MKTKQRDMPLAVDAIAEDGFFAGYASVFHTLDNHGEIIIPGAFVQSLQQPAYTNEVKLLWQHRMEEPVGKCLYLAEDEYGLYIEASLLLELQRGYEAYTLLKSGIVEGLSIGYVPVKSYTDQHSGIRYLTEVELLEVSLVTFPANKEAGVRV